MLEAEKILMNDAVIGLVYQVGAARLTKSYLKGIAYHPFGATYSLKWVEIKNE